jgi:hypothetical protein
MFRPTDSGYSEFQNELMYEAVDGMVTADNPLSSDKLDEYVLREYIASVVSDHWNRIPCEHYHFIAEVADTPAFYAGNDVDLTIPSADLIEKIAFNLVVEDTVEEFTEPRDNVLYGKLSDNVRGVLTLHETLDELEDEYDSASAMVDEYHTWLGENDVMLSLEYFSEAQVRRLSPISFRNDTLIDTLHQWTGTAP